MPDLKAKILKRGAHIPLDLKRKLSSIVDGKIRHGAIPPYQTGGMSPSLETGGYRPRVKNVYLCGSGSHPEPGVSTDPGRNAAEIIFSDLNLDCQATAAAKM